MRNRVRLAVVLIVVLAGAGCLGSSASTESPSTESPTVPASAGPDITPTNFEYINKPVNVSASGNVTHKDIGPPERLGEVTIVEDNQEGGDGFANVYLYENGTVTNQQGKVVGQVTEMKH